MKIIIENSTGIVIGFNPIQKESNFFTEDSSGSITVIPSHALDNGYSIVQVKDSSLPSDFTPNKYIYSNSKFEIITPKKSIEQLQSEIIEAVQKRLDDFAGTRGYDSILSACTYATSSVVKFKVEGQYCVDSRDRTWGKLYQILSEVQNGTRSLPSGYQDIEKDLPTLTWPVI